MMLLPLSAGTTEDKRVIFFPLRKSQVSADYLPEDVWVFSWLLNFHTWKIVFPSSLTFYIYIYIHTYETVYR